MNSIKSSISLLLIIGETITINAQQLHQSSFNEPCATMYMDSIRRAKHPELGSLAQWEDWFQQKINERKNSEPSAKKTSSYVLPVVIHIIHEPEDSIGVITNISESQVQSQINILNDCYTKQNSDINLLSTVYDSSNWLSVAADCEINFCLSKTNPNGNIMASPGIDRISRDSLGINASPYSVEYIENVIKPLTIWDPNKYLNIWVVKIEGGIMGYSTFPPNTTLTDLSSNFGTLDGDGVVLSYKVVGAGTTGNFKKGRTAVHEIGHWLGVRHIWGDDDNSNNICAATECSGSD